MTAPRHGYSQDNFGIPYEPGDLGGYCMNEGSSHFSTGPYISVDDCDTITSSTGEDLRTLNDNYSLNGHPPRSKLTVDTTTWELGMYGGTANQHMASPLEDTPLLTPDSCLTVAPYTPCTEPQSNFVGIETSSQITTVGIGVC
jgi:hypothetical protein